MIASLSIQVVLVRAQANFFAMFESGTVIGCLERYIMLYNKIRV